MSPQRGLPWPAPAQQSHLRCPCGSLGPSVAFAGTWQHTASLSPSQCTSSQLQTFPWETTTTKRATECLAMKKNHNHLPVFFYFILFFILFFLICLDMGPFPFQIVTGLNVGHLKCTQSTQYLTVKKT